MAAVGYAVLPTTISLSGLSSELQKQVLEPTQKVAQQAAQSIEKGIGGAVAAAGKDAQRAAQMQEKASANVVKMEKEVEKAKVATGIAVDKVKIAELDREKAVSTSASRIAKAEGDYQKLLSSGKASADDLARAEEKITQARLQGESDVLKKETSLAAARQKSVEAAANLESQERGLEGARAKALDAADNAVAAEKRLQDAQADTTAELGKSSEAVTAYGDNMDKAMALAGVAVAGAAVAIGKSLIDVGVQFDDMYDSIRVGTGASGEAFDGLQESARAVAREVPAMDGGLAQIGTTLADLNTRMGATGEPLETLTSQFVQLQNLGIDADINDVTGAFNQFNVSAEDAPANLDMLFQISQATGRTITELTGNLSKSGPALQEFGFGLEESAGLLGALDKAGLDSEKTVGSMTKAMSVFAKEGKDPQKTLWETISSIDDLTAAGKNAEAIDLANSIFGAKGGVGFVAAVESGQFAYDDFLDSIGATGDTILGVADETADFAESWEMFKQRAMLAVEPVATALFDKLAPAIEVMTEKFESLMGWISENQGLVTALAVGVGAAASAFLAWRTALIVVTAAQKAFGVATTIANGGMKALNASMRANVIGLIVTAVAGLVAGLVYFFTKTETGQKVWESFTKALATGWDMVTGVFTAGWEIIKSVVFDGWEWYTDRVKKNWELITGVLTASWEWVRDVFTAVWEIIKEGVFAAWEWYVDRVRSNWEFTTGVITAGWTWLKDTFVAVWEIIKTAVFMAWDSTVEYVRGRFDTVTWAISTSWTWLKDQLSAIWSWVKTNVFDSMTASLDVVKGWFDTTVDAIGTAWEKLRAFTARPVRFVVETVYGGIKKAWDAVAGLVGLDGLPDIPLGNLGAYASGGILPGYTPGKDIYRFIEPRTGMSVDLAGGEPILRPEAGKVLGSDWVDGINSAARMGGTSGVEKFLGSFANGGVIGSISNLVREKFPMMTITSTYRGGDPGHHGAGRAVDFSNGYDTTPQMQAATAWFAQNYGRELLELIHSPSPHNIKNGQSVGDGFGFYGAGTMNAHRNHVHVAAGAPLAGGGSGGVLGILEGAIGSVVDMAKSTWDGLINKIPSYEGSGGLFGDLPGAFLQKAAGAAWDFIADKASSIGAFFGDPGAGVEQWRPLVEKILESKGLSKDLADTTLRRMNQESGGNAKAINNWDINAANGVPSKGLMQVIDPTFAANKDPGFDDIWDPESNIRASMNYAVRRYGSLPAAYNQAGGYHLGGLAGRGQGWIKKTSLEPEYVLPPAATNAFIGFTARLPEIASALENVAREFGAATEEQDRIGRPDEWARHYGPQMGASIANDVLGLVGLQGLVGSPLRGSLVDLINTSADTANSVWGTGFGHLDGNVLVPASVLDDSGRVPGTKLARTDVAAVAGGVDPASPATSVSAAGGREVVIQVSGDAMTTEQVQELVDKLSEELGGVKVRVEKIESKETASVTSGIAGIV